MTAYLVAWVLVMLAVFFTVGVVLPACSALYTALRRRKARRVAAEEADLDRTLLYLASLRDERGRPRLGIVPEQRVPYDVEKGGL